MAPEEGMSAPQSPVLASRVFGAYLALSGAGFFLAPGAVLPLVGLAPTSDPWIRLVGLLTVILGMYFTRGGSDPELIAFRV